MDKSTFYEEEIGGKTNTSKAKGNRNERRAAKWLKKWTGIRFARTPNSGGLHWLASNQIAGDVICVDKDAEFPFCVEVKAHKHIPITPKLRANAKIYTFWQQTLTDAKRVNKIPLLMFREDGQKEEFYIVLGCSFRKYVLPLGDSVAHSFGDSIYDITVYSSSHLLTQDYKEFSELAKIYLSSQSK